MSERNQSDSVKDGHALEPVWNIDRRQFPGTRIMFKQEMHNVLSAIGIFEFLTGNWKQVMIKVFVPVRKRPKRDLIIPRAKPEGRLLIEIGNLFKSSNQYR